MKKFEINNSEYWGTDEGVFTLYVGRTEDIKAVYKSLMRNARNERSTSKLCPVFEEPARFSASKCVYGLEIKSNWEFCILSSDAVLATLMECGIV